MTTPKKHAIDRELVLQVMHHHCETAFTELFHIHYSWVFSKVSLALSNQEDVEDVTSIIFSKLWSKLQMKKWNASKGTFRAWLNIFAKNAIIDFLRAKARNKEYAIDFQDAQTTCDHQRFLRVDQTFISNDHLIDYNQPEPIDTMITDEARHILENALEQITKSTHRIAFILRHLENYEIKEVARILQRKDGTVKIWIFRCKMELREILDEYKHLFI